MVFSPFFKYWDFNTKRTNQLKDYRKEGVWGIYYYYLTKSLKHIAYKLNYIILFLEIPRNFSILFYLISFIRFEKKSEDFFFVPFYLLADEICDRIIEVNCV